MTILSASEIAAAAAGDIPSSSAGINLKEGLKGIAKVTVIAVAIFAVLSMLEQMIGMPNASDFSGFDRDDSGDDYDDVVKDLSQRDVTPIQQQDETSSAGADSAPAEEPVEKRVEQAAEDIISSAQIDEQDTAEATLWPIVAGAEDAVDSLNRMIGSPGV